MQYSLKFLFLRFALVAAVHLDPSCHPEVRGHAASRRRTAVLTVQRVVVQNRCAPRRTRRTSCAIPGTCLALATTTPSDGQTLNAQTLSCARALRFVSMSWLFELRLQTLEYGRMAVWAKRIEQRPCGRTDTPRVQ